MVCCLCFHTKLVQLILMNFSTERDPSNGYKLKKRKLNLKASYKYFESVPTYWSLTAILSYVNFLLN